MMSSAAMGSVDYTRESPLSLPVLINLRVSGSGTGRLAPGLAKKFPLQNQELTTATAFGIAPALPVGVTRKGSKEKAMNHMINRIAAAGALLLLNGAVAFAQSEMTVEVPFTFHTVGSTMAPGKYVITKIQASAMPYYKLRHESGKAVLVVPAQLVQPKKLGGEAEMAFLCAGEYCALQSIDVGFGNHIAVAPVRLKPGFAGQKVAEIRIPAKR